MNHCRTTQGNEPVSGANCIDCSGVRRGPRGGRDGSRSMSPDACLAFGNHSGRNGIPPHNGPTGEDTLNIQAKNVYERPEDGEIVEY